MHVRNPVEWGVDQVKSASSALGHAAAHRHQAAVPRIRRISFAEIHYALARGVEDFAAFRGDVVFLVFVYPLAGLVLARLIFGYDLLPLLFPLASGFALIGPIAAVGLYEMSRCREAGSDEVGWADAFAVFRSPAIGSIMLFGLLLLAIFAVWIGVASAIYDATLGPEPPVSGAAFVHDVFTTAGGWAMIGLGIGIGFLFAVGVLAISVVSVPLLLDRDVGLLAAVAASLRAVMANPVPMAAWGLIVAAGLVLGTAPLFLGLIFVLPVLGHATWHLYRRLVVPE
ncbi:MAG: DUF2189 domain-containing protein [Alphaproteobacteria bacterium]